MSETTHIEWATFTASPWYGCTKVSAGCTNCYAESWAKRGGKDIWGKGKPRQQSKSFESNCRKWEKESVALLAGWGARPRVFPSLCDWLDTEVPIAWLAELLRLIHETPHLDWLLLTKRPELYFSRVGQALDWLDGLQQQHAAVNAWSKGNQQMDCPANVWLGVSVEDQRRAHERIPFLTKIPARVRWLSVEPLLEPVFILPWLGLPSNQAFAQTGTPLPGLEKLDWVVIGGESGPNRRDCGVKAIIDVAEQCLTAGVPVFVKQASALRPGQQGGIPNEIWKLKQFPKQ